MIDGYSINIMYNPSRLKQPFYSIPIFFVLDIIQTLYTKNHARPIGLTVLVKCIRCIRCVYFPLNIQQSIFFNNVFYPLFLNLLIFRGKPGYAHVTFLRFHSTVYTYCIYLRQCIFNVRHTCHADCDCSAYTDCVCERVMWGVV